MNTPTVRIHVINGVAYVDEVPPGVVVQVTDYDVAAESPERDESGRPCSRYTVTAETPRWSEDVDPATIPDPVLDAEVERRTLRAHEKTVATGQAEELWQQAAL